MPKTASQRERGLTGSLAQGDLLLARSWFEQLVRMDDVSRNISGLNEASRAALQDADRLSEVSGALDSLSRHLTDLMARHG